MTRINEAIEALRDTTSTDRKLEILHALCNDRIAGEVLNYALNPYITFGINRPIRHPDLSTAKINDHFYSRYWSNIKVILNRLQARHLTGNEARIELEKANCGMNNLLYHIINKDLRAGVSIKLVNRAIPGLIPTFTVGKAADIRRGAKPTYPCLAEPKYDGVRVLAMFGITGDVQLMSSGGREYMNFPHILKELMGLGYRNKILDGEVYGDTFDKTMQVAHRGRSKKDNDGVDDASFIYNVFDMLDMDEFSAGVCSYPLATRRMTLQMTFGGADHVRLTHGLEVRDKESMWAYHDKIVALGYEGLILKNLNAKYPFKRTSNAWIKVKRMHTYKGVIVGVYEGKGRLSHTLGGIEVDIGGVITKVGSGFTDEERTNIFYKGTAVHGLGITIQGQELTESGCVRFPVFVEFEDKEIESWIRTRS